MRRNVLDTIIQFAILGVAFYFVLQFFGYVQCDHYTMTPKYVTEDTVTFEIDGHLYDWEYDSDKVTFTTDTVCKVSRFDYENLDPTDDTLTQVTIKQ